MRALVLVAILAAGVAAHGSADEPADTRTYWVCEGGWFAKTKDGTWYELNEQTYRKFGKPVKFKEVKRAKEYVELNDEERKVSVRLYEDTSEVRLDDRPNPQWEKLYKGKWQTPAAE
ncbi:MAG: hypothetical protein ACKODX_03520 [Gemmata sp.]